MKTMLAILVTMLGVARSHAQAPPGNGTFLRFDGINGRVTTGQWTSPVAHTLEAWIRVGGPNAGPFQTIAGHFGTPTNCGLGYGLLVSSSAADLVYDLDLDSCGGAGFLPRATLPGTGTWHHCAGTFDGTSIKLYLDGQLVQELANCTAGDCSGCTSELCWGADDTTTWFQIGCQRFTTSWATFFRGDIDEVRLWNLARTPAQIVQSMNTQLLGSETGLIGYWPFDAGTGAVATDLSGGQHHGALQGGVSWVTELVPRGFCFGDGSLATACPCANFGAPGSGCGNSVHPSGARLSSAGSIQPDTIDLTATGLPPGVATIYLQGDASSATGIVFGDGVRCVDGQLLRMGMRIDTDLDGATAFGPSHGDGPLSAAGGIVQGNTYAYQVYYRNASATWCPPATFNVTNGLTIAWP
ncbi:MAG: hypothetical protein HZA53_03105 [Planctomycetes bacterium]|nr:hypothetical protein [Planctomycetota bacterium]